MSIVRNTRLNNRAVSRSLGFSILEKLEDRRLLAGEVRLIGISGNQGNASYPDETLFDIRVGTPGTTDPVFLDGFFNHPNQTDTVLSQAPNPPPPEPPVASVGTGALRVDTPLGGFWGFASPNIVDALRSGATLLSYDMTLLNKELNGGSFGPNNDNFFTGFAQSNELAVTITVPGAGGQFIQRNFTTGGGQDSMGLGAQWSGQDGTRRITWDLNLFTSSDGKSLQQFVIDNNASEARFWFTTQANETNPTTFGPTRFYFDNFELFSNRVDVLGDFELFSAQRMPIALPFVPDTDSIAFNPENGLLYRAAGSETWSNTPTSPGYRDNQSLYTIDLFAPGTPQTAIFNANPDVYGMPAPRPNWVLPAQPRTPEQNSNDYRDTPGIGVGPNEYHAVRDFVWDPVSHLFYTADENGIFKLTADGQSTFVGRPAGGPGEGGGEDDLKGLAFFNVAGQRRLLASERADSGTPANLWTIDPATGQKIGDPVILTDANGIPLNGVLSLAAHPDGTTLYGIAQGTNAFDRSLVTIDPVTGMTTKIGDFGLHMADLAFVVTPALGIAASQFLFQTAPNQLQVTFSANIDPASLTADDLSVQRLPGDPPFTATAVSYDPGTKTATFTLPGAPLTDGNYRATIAAGSVNDAGGAPSTDAMTANFFVFAGDINRDRTVDFNDLAVLAQNYNQLGGKTFGQGDFNYDGDVDFDDLAMMAQRYNTSLPAPGAAGAPVASAAPSPLPDIGTTRKQPTAIFNTTIPIRPSKPLKPIAKRRAD